MVDKKSKKFLVILMIGLLVLSVALTGCTEENENGEDSEQNGDSSGDQEEDTNGSDGTGEDEMSGVVTYSGEWSGTIGYTEEYNGTWQFDVDFDNGTVSGWFEGDGSGDITGSVSDGVIQASGEAGFGYVEWEGQFSSDGSEISGTWEVPDVSGSSGTWSGTEGEL